MLSKRLVSVIEATKIALLESGEHPWALIDQVCSPGGTTIEGVCSLEANGFEAALCKAFDAVYEKDKRL